MIQAELQKRMDILFEVDREPLVRSGLGVLAEHPHLMGHARNTADLAILAGAHLGLSDDQLKLLGRGGYLSQISLTDLEPPILEEPFNRLNEDLIKEINAYGSNSAQRVQEWDRTTGNTGLPRIIEGHRLFMAPGSLSDEAINALSPSLISAQQSLVFLSPLPEILAGASIYAALGEVRHWRGSYTGGYPPEERARFLRRQFIGDRKIVQVILQVA